MNWVQDAKKIFKISKPEHFTNYEHCEECAEHDETLLSSAIDTIGLDELGSPGWDPICFSTSEGKIYYMPAFVRLSLDTIDNEFYLGQLIYHLESDGKNSDFYNACNDEQRKFIARLMEFMITHYTAQLVLNGCEDEALKVYGIWAAI